MKRFLFAAAVALFCCTLEASVQAQTSGVRIGPSADDLPVSNNYNRKAPRTDAKPASKTPSQPATTTKVEPPAATATATATAAENANAKSNAGSGNHNSDAKGNDADKNPSEKTTNVSSAATAAVIDPNSASMTTDAPARPLPVPVAPIVAASKNDSSPANDVVVPSNPTSTQKGAALPSKTVAPKPVESNTTASSSNAASKLNASKTSNKPAPDKTVAPPSASTIPVSSTTTLPPVSLTTSATTATVTPATTADANASVPAAMTSTRNAAAPPPAPVAVLPPTETYRIGAGDVLDIRLLNQGATRESTLFTVIDGGLLEYPLAGAPRVVTGLTTEEISALLAEELQRRAVYEKPRVLVSVREYASHTVLVSGLVSEPGAKIMRREAMPLYVVVAEAQPKPEAGRAVVVSRSTGQTTTVDLTDAAAMNALVYAGDVVQVQPRPREFFYIGGAVNMPGQKDFHAGLTLTQAVLASGGLIDAANNRVRVSRQGADGRLISTEYVLRDIDEGKVPDPGLKPGDRIEVIRGKR